MMRKYRVYIGCISTGNFAYDEIEDTSRYGERISEFIDSAIDSDCVYAVYSASIPSDETDKYFTERYGF